MANDNPTNLYKPPLVRVTARYRSGPQQQPADVSVEFDHQVDTATLVEVITALGLTPAPTLSLDEAAGPLVFQPPTPGSLQALTVVPNDLEVGARR